MRQGLTFKENCPDLRNTRVVDIVTELKEYNCQVDVYDPWISAQRPSMSTAVERLNYRPSKVLGGKSPHEVLFGVEMCYTKPPLAVALRT
jgi:UDP-N-acetyl-D-mannosaminuronate dehydrogenase